MQHVSDHDGSEGEPGSTDPSGQSQLDALGLSDEEKVVLARVGDILRRIRFGTVVLVVQDAKVVQIEMAEKFRLR